MIDVEVPQCGPDFVERPPVVTVDQAVDLDALQETRPCRRGILVGRFLAWPPTSSGLSPGAAAAVRACVTVVAPPMRVGRHCRRRHHASTVTTWLPIHRARPLRPDVRSIVYVLRSEDARRPPTARWLRDVRQHAAYQRDGERKWTDRLKNHSANSGAGAPRRDASQDEEHAKFAGGDWA